MATVEVRDGRPVVVRSGAGADAAAIRTEALTLGTIAGPGAPSIVEFEDDGDRARLVIAVAPPLIFATAPLPIVLDALARVADVLERANAAGIGHGPIRDDDVLADGASVTLTGWHRTADASPDGDVAAFGQLVAECAVRHRELEAIARRAVAPDPPTLSALAAALRSCLPRDRTRRSHPSLRIAVLAIAITAALAAVVAFARTPRAPRHAIVLNAATDVVVNGNRVERAGRAWVVGRPGDIVVVGAWNCDGTQLPAVLRRDAGRVWLFTSWPTRTAPVISRQATDVPGALQLRVERDGACDHLAAVDRQGRVTYVR